MSLEKEKNYIEVIHDMVGVVGEFKKINRVKTNVLISS
jgi:hypothetical protein